MNMNSALTCAFGLTQSHLSLINKDFSLVQSSDEQGIAVHRDVVEPLQAMRNEAKKAGFNLSIASAFRDFTRQLSIFNRKAQGQLAVRDSQNQVIDIDQLSKTDLLWAILHFSALPGASRHHWGTDFDFYDPSLLPAGKSLALEPWEYQPGGYFYSLNQWLDEHCEQFGFYRPYAKYNGGVAHEPWHFSHFRTAEQYQVLITLEHLTEQIANSDISLKAEIMDNIDIIFHQYIHNIAEPPYV